MTTSRQHKERPIANHGQGISMAGNAKLRLANRDAQNSSILLGIQFDYTKRRRLLKEINEIADQTKKPRILSLASANILIADPIEYTTLSSTASGRSTIKTESRKANGSLFEIIETGNNVLLQKNYSLPNHQQLRCACFACRSAQVNENTNKPFGPSGPGILKDGDNGEPSNGLNRTITTTAPNIGFYSKSSLEVQALTLDSLAALNSPYIAGTFVGAKWGSIDPDSGATTELSYYITPERVRLSDGSRSVASTAAERSAIDIANAAFMDVANLSFVETTTDDRDANFRWSFASSPWLGMADLPGFNGNVTSDVIIYNNHYSGNDGAMNAGGYYYTTLPHELGHAMGLAHPHNGGGEWEGYYEGYGSELFPGLAEDDWGLGGDNYLNTTPFSTMSYNDTNSTLKSPNSSGDTTYVTPGIQSNYGYAEGLGAFDIATLQYLYGPNMTKGASTDDVYMLDSTNLNGYKTIWDNGGTDEISAVNSSDAVYIDLRSATLLNEVGGGGYISRVDNAYIGYTIAYNTTGTAIIENAVGSSYSDRIIGNSSANTLKGGGGNDVLNGKLGNDRLIGGKGSDTAVFSSRDNNVDLRKKSRQQTGDGRDKLISIENVNGGSGRDTIIGNNRKNILNGENGNDQLFGGGGNDLLIGGKGKNEAWGEEGRDTFRIQSGAGHTIIKDFQDGDDRIHLGSGYRGLRIRERGDDLRIFLSGDLMAIVEDAAGNLQRSGNYLI